VSDDDQAVAEPLSEDGLLLAGVRDERTHEEGRAVDQQQATDSGLFLDGGAAGPLQAGDDRGRLGDG